MAGNNSGAADAGSVIRSAVPQVMATWLLSACAVAVAATLLSLPPLQHPDTASYLAHSPERAPLYPLIIDVFQAVFAQSAFLWLARFQAACLLAAGIWFALRVGRLLGLGASWRLGMFLILCAPGLKFSSAILAEPLSYALLIAFWALLAGEALCGRSGSSPWLAFLCAVALLLRPQAIFLPVTYGLYLLGRLPFQPRRSVIAALALLLFALAGGLGLRGADNAWRNGSYSTASSGGVHLLASVLYISDEADQEALADPRARELFTRSLAKAEALGFTRRHWDMGRSHFDVSMERLVFDIVRPVLSDLLPATGTVATQAEQADGLALKTAKTLIWHKPLDFAALLARKVYDGQPFYYALLVLAGCFALAFRRTVPAAGLFALAVLQSCLSYGVILLAGVFSLRYLLPADAIALAVALALGGVLRQRCDRKPSTA